MDSQIIVRQFVEADAVQVRELFIKVNRLLAPANLNEAFETYIDISLRDEIDKIPDYYSEKNGHFWVAAIDVEVVGMFGLEQSGPDAMELRRMYVDPERRRHGIARKMLLFAEDRCRADCVRQIILSTSEIQTKALSLYRASGYRLVREEIAEAANNKTIGEGIRRYHFSKDL